MKTINHWINGKNVASKEYFTTSNPANGEVLAEVASGGQLEIDPNGSIDLRCRIRGEMRLLDTSIVLRGHE